MKFKPNAPSWQPSDAALATSSHRQTGVGHWGWSLGAALLIGLSGSGCGRTGNSSAESTPPPVPSPTLSPAGTPVVATTPTPTPEPTLETPHYSGTQQMEYIRTAQEAFMEARGAKSTPVLEANTAFNQAGGASAKGLTSKAAIAQRRALIEACRQANEDYLTFATTQPEAYRTELAKTPLTKSDVEGLVSDFTAKGKQEEIVKLRRTERESLKTADEMMAYLDKTYGSWTLNDNKPTFKRSSDANAYSTLGKKYNGFVSDIQKLQTEVNAPLPTPGESPIPSASPSVAQAPGVQPAVASPAVNPPH